MKNKITELLNKNVTQDEYGNYILDAYPSDIENLVNELLEAINYTHCCTELPKIELLTLDGFIFSHFNKLKGNQYIRKTDYKIFSLENITLEYDRLKIIQAIAYNELEYEF